MSRLYKLIDRALWREAVAQGHFDGAGVDLADGYIHFSTAAQAPETARRYFSGQKDLLLLTLETDRLPPAVAQALRWEPARGGDLFPHLYTPLDPTLVSEARALHLGEDGVPDLGSLEP
jgi:uncharacterized protein (DUF952 family)